MIPCTAFITTRTRLACSPSCKCKACDREIIYAHPAHKLAVKIGEREFTAHYQGLCMADRFHAAMARAKA